MHIFYGTPGVGLSTNNIETWTRDSEGFPVTSLETFRFGTRLDVEDYNSNTYTDLRIFFFEYEYPDINDRQLILYGGSNGLSP